MNPSFAELEKKLAALLKENLDRRKKMEGMAQEQRDQARDFFLAIIKTLDNFESKEESLTKKYGDDHPIVSPIVRSYGALKRQLLALLEKHGIKPLEFPDNQIVAGYCNVLDTEPDSTLTNGSIIAVVRNGYIRDDELIRAADLIVVKN